MTIDHGLELEQIQGIVLRGYVKQLPCAAYLMLQFSSESILGSWLREVQTQLSFLTPTSDDTNRSVTGADSVVNLAFTYSGLEFIPLSDCVREGFSNEFKLGMANELKSRQLGDEQHSHFNNWQWGNDQTRVDALLILFTADESELETQLSKHKNFLQNHAIDCIADIRSSALTHGREHFGFRDGISQPKVSGYNQAASNNMLADHIAPGEFVLGYRNHYQQCHSAPLVAMHDEFSDQLPWAEEVSGFRSLGRNGSYLVFRQLQQHVERFWNTVSAATDSSEAMITAAAKMVGRWPNGEPLMLRGDYSATTLRPSSLLGAAEVSDVVEFSDTELNNFQFKSNDPDGFKCPVGSHIRRCNPRDDMELTAFEGSLQGSNQQLTHAHRILRRGRPYGRPLITELDPQMMAEMDEPPTPAERGLLFLAINANIARQFEFIQQSWINNPNFTGKYKEDDPLLGARAFSEDQKSDFTVPHYPLKSKLNALPRFVTVKGGAYFFVPSKAALRYFSYVLDYDRR